MNFAKYSLSITQTCSQSMPSSQTMLHTTDIEKMGEKNPLKLPLKWFQIQKAVALRASFGRTKSCLLGG